MRIHGLQKMTLLDFPGKVACTVFLGGCDFRCPFCHNSDLLDMMAEPLMDEHELLKFLEKRKNLLDGVAFTGGEPLLRKDLDELLGAIKDMGYLVKLDTNGNHPDHLKQVVEAGLVDYVAMDIKNSPRRYAETIGLKTFDLTRVNESRSYLLEGRVDYEFRTTIVKEFHDEESMAAIGPWIRGAKRYFLQNFVDREQVMYQGLSAHSENTLKNMAKIVEPYVNHIEIRGI